MNTNQPSVKCYALWITILILWISPPSTGLKCYVCHSLTDENCVDLDGMEYLVDCRNATGNYYEQNFTNCRKQVFSVESTAFDMKDERVVRSCGIEKHHKYRCFYSSTVDLKSSTCECVEDGCNIAQLLSADVTMLSSLIMFVFLFLT